MSRSPRGQEYTRSRSPTRKQDENRPRSMSLERHPRRQGRSPTRPAHSKDTRVSLYVSGLGPKVTEDDLYKHFAKQGKVLRSTDVHTPGRLVLTFRSVHAKTVLATQSCCRHASTATSAQPAHCTQNASENSCISAGDRISDRVRPSHL